MVEDPQPSAAGLNKALEALLLVAEAPAPIGVLADVLDVAPETVSTMLRELRRRYVDEEHGFVLREAGGGWRLYTEPSTAPYVERFLLSGSATKLSQAALETLAVVAYEQPVTRARVSEIRGVDADAVVRTLVSRGLVAEVGRADTLGQPLLYGTTTDFLERLGLRSVEELPDIAEFDVPGPIPAEPPVGGYRQARRELSVLDGVGSEGAHNPQHVPDAQDFSDPQDSPVDERHEEPDHSE